MLWAPWARDPGPRSDGRWTDGLNDPMDGQMDRTDRTDGSDRTDGADGEMDGSLS